MSVPDTGREPRYPLVGSVRGRYVLVGYALGVTLIGAGLPSPLYGLYQREYGFSTGLLTLAFAIYSFTLLPALLLCGPMSDRVGHRKVLAAGLSLTVVTALLFLSVQGLACVLIARAVQGLGVAAVLTAGTALAVERHPHGDRARAAFLATTSTPAGLAAGCALAGLLAQYVPWPTRTCFVVELALLVPAFLAAAPPRPTRLATRAATADSADTPGSVQQLGAGYATSQAGPALIQKPHVPAEMRRPFMIVSVAVFAAWAVGGVFLSVAPSYAAQLAATRNLALLGAVPALMFASAVVGEVAAARTSPRRALLLGAALLVGGLATVVGSFPAASLPVLLLGAVLCGAGLGLTFLAALTVINQLAPEHQRGKITAAFYIPLFTGNALPVIGLGSLAGVLSLASSVAISAALIATLTVVTTVLNLIRPTF